MLAFVPCLPSLLPQGSSNLHGRKAARAPSPVLAAFADTNEFYWLKDRLMERAVAQQMDRFRYIGDLAQSMWLKDVWQSFEEEQAEAERRKEKDRKMGDAWRFLAELQNRDTDMISVPTGGGFRQGSPGNPYIKPRPQYRVEMIQPQSVAKRLVACREQLAEEWSSVLQLLGTGEPHEAHPHEGMLEATATRCAVREVMDDSSKACAEYLRREMASITRDLGPAVAIDCDALLKELAARPLVVTATTLIDPPEMSEQIREKCKEIELEASPCVLSSTLEDHSTLYSSFLDSCFVGDED